MRAQLPKQGTKAWSDEVAFYIKASPEERQRRAVELKYTNIASYMNAMARRSIRVSHEKHPAITSDYKLPPDTSWAEHLRIMREMDDLVAYHQRVPAVINFNVDTDLPIGWVYTADWQLGAFGVDYESFERDTKVISQEPGLFAYVGGDGYQNIIQASKIGSSHNQVPISVQKGLYVLTLKMLAGMLPGQAGDNHVGAIGTGNHNYWTALAEGEDWDGELAKRLNLVYTKHAGIVNLTVGKQKYPILRMHKGSFNSSFNLTHSCKQYQRMHFPEARVVVIEHQHMAAVEQYRYDGQECVAIRPGTYHVYDDFAQQNGFFGSHVCTPMTVFFPKEDKIVGFKDMRDGITFLRAVRKGN